MPTGQAQQPVLLAWSTGKDSALALHALREGGRYNVVGLLTTLTEPDVGVGMHDGGVGMHGVCEALLDRQAENLALPLTKVRIPRDDAGGLYEQRMRRALGNWAERGVTTVAFGDLFLEDLRRQREEKLAAAGCRGLFPLWQQETAKLARRFLALGFRAVVTNVDASALDETLAGRDYDENFLRRLPDAIDPCGENGEFHTFVHAGPVFRRPVAFEIGQASSKDGRFYTCDLRPASGGAGGRA